jgi:hypothetical protein
MKLLTQVPESAMVAAFLKAELTSVRFSDELRKVILSLGIAKSVVANPNIENEEQNKLRAQLLGDYRGYKQNSKIFENFPDDLKWFKAEISREELGNLQYVDYSYWNELTDHTHKVKDAVKNIQKGKIVFEVSNDRFLEVAEQIRQGDTDFEPMILWGKDENSPLTILEGHLRATAFGLAGEKAPATLAVIAGFKVL